MDWEQVIRGVAGVLVSIAAGLITKWFSVKLDKEQREKAIWAIEQGVAYAAEHFRNRPQASGDVKKAEALELAHSIAPKAMKKLEAAQTSKLVDATYAKMRASLPTTAWVAHGDALTHQTESVAAARPTPLPPVKRPL